jgi:hypothetical protein
VRRAALCALAAAFGCRGGEEKKVEPPPAEEPARPPVEQPAPAEPVALVPEELPPETAEASLLERAYPAWGAVLERASLLARRGQRGAAYGRVARIDGTTWLIDETPGARGLGIRIGGAGGARLEVAAGRRVLAFGAWEAADRRWVWRVERLVGLRAAGGDAPALAVDPVPGKLLASGAAPEGARVFWVLAAPVKAGDGWTIADEKDGPPVATLLLPGEVLGAPYGGLDYLAPEERWTLARGKPYAAPVTEVQLRRKLPLPVLRASAPPVAVAAQ